MEQVAFTPSDAPWIRLRAARRTAVLPALFLLPVLLALGGRELPAAALYAGVAALFALAVVALVAWRDVGARGTREAVAVMERVAAGELGADFGGGKDRPEQAGFDRLSQAVATMTDSLAAVVRQVRVSAQSIAAAADAVSEGNERLAQRTEEQAASLEQTAGGMAQLAATALQNADHCARATGLASRSAAVSVEAAERMHAVVAIMRSIDASARRVGEILGTVEGIAFQTNILALNAAVEAARAGEHGRGFAVVAAEVRKLSHGCAAAAREIQVLVRESVGSVEQGGQLVTAAEGTMAEAVASVGELTEVLTAIALASREQSAAVQEINQAMLQVDAATQENAALVQEAASAAPASFQQESSRLLAAVDRFKIDRSDDRGRVVALVKAAAQHVRRQGVGPACADFNDPRGSFVRGEDYIVALDFQGTRLAFAPRPETVGQSDWDLTDADGKPFSRQLVQLAQALGFGWLDYRMVNPRTGRPEAKSMYFERVGEILVACGIYRGGG